MSSRPLTTTSYAILGVLAIRPWSAYDLTGYMRTSAVRRCWPRTESRLYAEPKNLVAHGLAVATKEFTGRRRRTVYRITEGGRKALREWLGEACERSEVQDETLLKILLGDHGTREHLLATIRGGMEELRDRVTEVRKISDRMEVGEFRFPERLHVSAIASRNGVELLRQRFEFLTWADKWVRTWKDTTLDDDKRKVAMEVLRRSRTSLLKLDEELQGILDEGERAVRSEAE